MISVQKPNRWSRVLLRNMLGAKTGQNFWDEMDRRVVVFVTKHVRIFWELGDFWSETNRGADFWAETNRVEGGFE